MLLVNQVTFNPELDLIFYSDQFSLIRSLRKSLLNIIKTNSFGYKAVEYEDPKSLPFFSFKPYKKKEEAKQEDSMKAAAAKNQQ